MRRLTRSLYARTALTLALAFVVFQAAAQAGVISASASSLLVATVALSMLLSPLLLVLADRVIAPRLQRSIREQATAMPEISEPQDAPIVIAGFGRVVAFPGAWARAAPVAAGPAPPACDNPRPLASCPP